MIDVFSACASINNSWLQYSVFGVELCVPIWLISQINRMGQLHASTVHLNMQCGLSVEHSKVELLGGTCSKYMTWLGHWYILITLVTLMFAYGCVCYPHHPQDLSVGTDWFWSNATTVWFTCCVFDAQHLVYMPVSLIVIVYVVFDAYIMYDECVYQSSIPTCLF